MSRSQNIALHVQCAFSEIAQRKPDLLLRLARRIAGITRALSPFYK